MLAPRAVDNPAVRTLPRTHALPENLPRHRNDDRHHGPRSRHARIVDPALLGRGPEWRRGLAGGQPDDLQSQPRPHGYLPPRWIPPRWISPTQMDLSHPGGYLPSTWMSPTHLDISHPRGSLPPTWINTPRWMCPFRVGISQRREEAIPLLQQREGYTSPTAADRGPHLSHSGHAYPTAERGAHLSHILQWSASLCKDRRSHSGAKQRSPATCLTLCKVKMQTRSLCDDATVGTIRMPTTFETHIS